MSQIRAIAARQSIENTIAAAAGIRALIFADINAAPIAGCRP